MIESPSESLHGVSAMSPREIYAGIALWGLASAMGNADPRGAKTNIWKPEHVVDKAVQLADEMVRRLARGKTA
jgi:hypothetical protein